MISKSFHYPETLRGKLQGKNVRAALVVSRFHEELTKRLALGALQTFKEAGIEEDALVIHYVPGVFEIPTMVAYLNQQQQVAHQFSMMVVLGVVIRGETEHHHYLSQAVMTALASYSMQYPRLALGNGILTVNDMAQATARAGGDLGNKGEEAAAAALDLFLSKNLNYR